MIWQQNGEGRQQLLGRRCWGGGWPEHVGTVWQRKVFFGYCMYAQDQWQSFTRTVIDRQRTLPASNDFFMTSRACLHDRYTDTLIIYAATATGTNTLTDGCVREDCSCLLNVFLWKLSLVILSCCSIVIMLRLWQGMACSCGRCYFKCHSPVVKLQVGP